MDRLPQIPTNEGANDTVGVLRSAFQENIEANIFPQDIAENITKYVVDEELSLKETAQNVLKINRAYATEADTIKETELEIIKEHGGYLYNKYLIDQNLFLKELTKLKPCDIFTNISPDDVEKYGLIQKCDLYPDLTRQFLDFRFNRTHHQCQICFPAIETKKIILKTETRPTKPPPEKSAKQATAPKTCFIINPKEVTFSNFDIGRVYEQTVKIINTSHQLQTITLRTPPKLSIFSLKFCNCRIAPGMSAIAKIQFTPEVKLNLQDEAIFKSRIGSEIKLPIKCQRNPPKLFGYIFKSNDFPNMVMDQHIPGSRNFSKRRRTALNDTIDCGSCFVTNYILLNLLLTNNGASAKFFWISEEDFYSENKVSTALELCHEGFWIYPTYFEILKEQTSEINIIFQPKYCGLHVQTLFLMCDNNNYRQIEIIGDSICFNRNMISVDIPNLAKEIDKQEEHCIFLGHARDKDFIRFTLCITNHSSVFLKYEFVFQMEDEKFDMSKWIQITNTTPALAPYSVTDVIFHVKAETGVDPGYYKTTLRLFMKDIPIASLHQGETFLVTTNHKPLEEIVNHLSVVDVLVLDVGVACYMESEPKQPEKLKNDNDIFECKKCGKKSCFCEECNVNTPQANLVFSESLLDMGILPTGVNIQKKFYIMNFDKKQITWKIVEIKYNITTHPHVELIPDSNLTLHSGVLLPEKKQKLSYNIVKKQPVRWVSVLVLFSISTEENVKENQNTNHILVAESICVVTYEIIHLNIVIKTGSSQDPILCPLQMLYTGVPLHLSFKIQNFSLITGCFYFLKPIGKDVEKVQVEYKPQCGELKPLSKKTIRLKLTCNDVGILENIFLPCFIGQGQKPILVRLLCVVDCIHVFFYLPNRTNEYEKILWPPKVLYEYDRSWSQYCMCEELSEEYENMVQNIQSENTSQIMEKSSKTLSEIKTSKSNINDQSELDSDSNQELLKILVNVDSDIFLQDNIMEVENVPAKQPRKITFYFENFTPKSAKYTIQSTNYAAKENFIEDAVATTYKTTEELWEPMIVKHGILVHPETESGTLNSHELQSANIWIYANTWGIYTEEIVVDIEEMACFTFSMIIEIVGCPLHIPLSVGAITKYPTIRFGSAAIGGDNITKNIVMLNTSSIDVKISWHMFYCYNENEDENLPPFNFICDVIQKSEERLEFDFTERFFGVEGGDCVEILPSQMHMSSNSRTTIPITFKPCALKCDKKKCSMRCYILGRIFIHEQDRFKSSYFYRKNNSILIEVTANVEKPHLNIIAEAENNSLFIYANEVALNRGSTFYMKLIARNTTSSVVEAQLECSEPFAFQSTKDKIILKPGECKKTEIKEYHQPARASTREEAVVEVVTLPTIDKDIDEENKILTIHRKLLVYYKGGLKDAIPVNACIYYPNIAVKPLHVKFGYLLLGRTQKTSITVFNLTGYRVLFEILKSTSSQEIVVTPTYGEIEKSTGMNHSFVNITIYFTPTECRNYQESIRIWTNIPQYHIDVPIKGAGSFNEKFDGGS